MSAFDAVPAVQPLFLKDGTQLDLIRIGLIRFETESRVYEAQRAEVDWSCDAAARRTRPVSIRNCKDPELFQSVCNPWKFSGPTMLEQAANANV